MLIALLAFAVYFAFVAFVLLVFRAAARADERTERERPGVGTAQPDLLHTALEDLARETRRGRFRRRRREAAGVP